MLESNDISVLADIGFTALFRGRDRDALAIFTGVQAARPGVEAGAIGIALVHLLRGDIDQAIACLRQLPPSEAASIWLGIALARQGNFAGARAKLASVIEGAPAGPFAAFAEKALQELARSAQRQRDSGAKDT